MRYRQLIIISSLSLVVMATSMLAAQETNKYVGPFQLGKYVGIANYEYSVIDTDTVLDGNFEFQRTNPKALLEKKDVSFLIQGQFEKKQPNGYWSFRFNEFQTSRKNIVQQDNKYVLNVNGEQQIAFGNLKNGYPDGEWIVKNQRIKDSDVDEVHFNSVIEFSDGIPQRSFRIEDNQQELVGRFLRNGLAHDKWTLFSDAALEEIESWYFNEGILQRIELRKGNRTQQISVDAKPMTETEIMNLGEKYLKIIKLKLSIDNQEVTDQSSIAYLINENDLHYQRIDTILSTLNNAVFEPKFKVSVPYYSLTSNEEKLLDSIVKYYRKSQKISDFLRNDTQLNIRKLSDKDVRSQEDAVEAITQEILVPLKQISAFANDQLLKYIQRDRLIDRFWSQGISDIKNFDQYGIKVIDEVNEQKDPLELIKNLSEQTFFRLDTIRAFLEKKIDKQEKQQEAILLEKEMIAQRDRYTVLVNAIIKDSIPNANYNAIKKLQNDLEQKLSKYAAIDNVDQKLSQAKELAPCFKRFVEVGEIVLKLPEQQKQIKQSYTDAVWNPFIATVMDEVVKKRIVAAYENVLISYFLEKIENGLSCEDAPKWIELVNKTYDRMLELREEDTKKMERKLKKESDPLIILQRFQIQHRLNQNSK